MTNQGIFYTASWTGTLEVTLISLSLHAFDKGVIAFFSSLAKFVKLRFGEGLVPSFIKVLLQFFDHVVE